MEPVPGGKPSKVEGIKLASEYLGGALAREVRDETLSHLSEDAGVLRRVAGSVVYHGNIH